VGLDGSSLRLTVRVRPGARQNSVVSYADGVLTVRIAAPPSEGRANEALLKFVGSLLGVRPWLDA